VDDSGTHLVHYDYSPFGVQSSNVYSSPFTVSLNPFGFSSEYFDSTTGLVEYKYRKYNPYLGKFLSRDPIEEKGGLNLYAICGNDLINKVDINGLWPGVCEDLGEDDVFEDWQFVHVEPVIEQQLVNNGTYFIQEFDVYWIREYKRKYCCCGKEVWRTGYSDKKIELTADNDTGYPYYGMSNPMGVSIVPTALYSQLVTQIGNATSFAPLKTDLHTQDQVRNRAMQNAPKDYEYGNIVAPKTKLCW
jgi:RHS repeat-associated protein